MPTITTKDGTIIYYKDWGKGQPLLFSHGWPLSADAWEDQMIFLAARGYRCIAHDRRGHGRSGQPWDGNDMDTYAADRAELVTALDLRDAIHIGHSTAGGEVTRYIGRYGTERVAKAVLISAIPPLMLKTAANPTGLPIEVFDNLRAAVLKDRSQYFNDLSVPVYGIDRPGAQVSQATDSAKPHPRPVEAFLGSHPKALKFVQEVSRVPASFATESFYNNNALLFVNDKQDKQAGRYQIVPMSGSQYLNENEAEAKGKSSNFLSDELRDRLANASVKFRLLLQLAGPGDQTNDDSVVWPENRRKVELGRSPSPPWSDDPLPALRSSVYVYSVLGRQKE